MHLYVYKPIFQVGLANLPGNAQNEHGRVVRDEFPARMAASEPTRPWPSGDFPPAGGRLVGVVAGWPLPKLVLRRISTRPRPRRSIGWGSRSSTRAPRSH